MSNQPLQVLLFRHPEDSDSAPLEDALVRAFYGGKDAAGYLPTGDDLGIQLEVYGDTPLSTVQENLSGACHTLVVVLVDDYLLGRPQGLWQWLAECWRAVSASQGQHRMVAVVATERHGTTLLKRQPEFGSLQLLQMHSLGEPAARPAKLGLFALHQARALVNEAIQDRGPEQGHMKLFISHAKVDGLPLAHALKHEIASMPWLEKFYDAEDLLPGCDWPRGLEQGVATSVVIMLRTDAYDSRPWCQREVLWADEYCAPTVLVEARTVLVAPVARLPFDTAPTVRIPDGNLLRILFAALREGLRFALFRRRVKAMDAAGVLAPTGATIIFGTQPSVAALLRVCNDLTDKGVAQSAVILYPDPPLRAGLFEAAHALVASVSPGALLATPQTLAALGGGK